MRPFHAFALSSFLLVSAASAADVLVALPSDAALAPLEKAMKAVRHETHARWNFTVGVLNDKEVVLVRTEHDPLNAVAATTLALRHYQPKRVLCGNVGRAHEPSLKSGTWVIASSFVPFDGMVSPRTPAGTGSEALTWEKLPHLPIKEGTEEVQERFPVEEASRVALEKVAASLKQPSFTGGLGSAYQIDREADRLVWLGKTWGTHSEDTTTAFIAGTAFLQHVPVAGAVLLAQGDGQVESDAEAEALGTLFLKTLGELK